MENTEKVKETPVVNINKYKSSIEYSPLLEGDAVEVKEYTTSMSNAGNVQQQTQFPPEGERNLQQPPTQPQVENNYQFNPVNPQNTDFVPPQDEYMGDGIDPMEFGESAPKQEAEEEGEKMSPRMAEQSAGAMISLYSMIVPPMLYNITKNDVGKFKRILEANKQVPYPEIQKLEKFLNTKNSEIEKALQLSKDQVILLKQALAAVLEHYKIAPSNPLVNLLAVIIGIAISQYMAVSAIIKSQNEQLASFIENFKVTVPEGVSMGKKSKLFKKEDDLEQAA